MEVHRGFLRCAEDLLQEGESRGRVPNCPCLLGTEGFQDAGLSVLEVGEYRAPWVGWSF